MAAKTTDETSEMEALKNENTALKKKLEQRAKMTGWLITAPNANYSGSTMGYRFRNGKVFVSDGEGAIDDVKRLCNDFGYTFERVDDFETMPEQQRKEVKANMIDQLLKPSVV